MADPPLKTAVNKNINKGVTSVFIILLTDIFDKMFCQQLQHIPKNDRKGQTNQPHPSDHFTDERPCPVDQLLVLVVGTEGVSETDFNPFDLSDFGCLRDKVEVARPAQKVDHVLFNFPPRGVGDNLPETGTEVDVDSGFLQDFSDSGLLFGFARLDRTFGEGPVPAAGMLDQQQFGIAVIFAEDDRAAGFSYSMLLPPIGLQAFRIIISIISYQKLFPQGVCRGLELFCVIHCF